VLGKRIGSDPGVPDPNQAKCARPGGARPKSSEVCQTPRCQTQIKRSVPDPKVPDPKVPDPNQGFCSKTNTTAFSRHTHIKRGRASDTQASYTFYSTTPTASAAQNQQTGICLVYAVIQCIERYWHYRGGRSFLLRRYD
jgi:hypothetical protein